MRMQAIVYICKLAFAEVDGNLRKQVVNTKCSNLGQLPGPMEDLVFCATLPRTWTWTKILSS